MVGSQETVTVVGLRAYADSRAERNLPGGTLGAVQKAIGKGLGRIAPAAVQVKGRGGKPEWKIRDAALADKLWEEGRSPDQAPRAMTAAASPQVAPPVPGGSPSELVPSPTASVEQAGQQPATADPIQEKRIEAADRQIRFLDHRATREEYQARIARAKAVELEESVLPVDEVAAEQEKTFRMWSEQLQSLALRVGREVSFRFSLTQEEVVRVVERALADFRRDVAADMEARVTRAA